MKRSGQLLGAVLVLLGVYGVGFESGNGVGALWEHWWCTTPLAVILLGVAALITAHRMPA